MSKVRRQPTYRESVPTQSVLTITSNVVYASTPAPRRTDAGRASRSLPARTR
jgi:formate C-acetyltransferase